MLPPVQSNADAIVTSALPVSAPPLDSSRRPSPVKAVAASALTVPESRCSAPSPARLKLPAMPLLPALSDRSRSAVPAASWMFDPLSAVISALPPVPEAM